jgi:hypothetical protein
MEDGVTTVNHESLKIDSPIALFDTNELTVKVFNDPPRVWWTDGPREDEEEYETLGDALVAFTEGITERVKAGYYL